MTKSLKKIFNPNKSLFAKIFLFFWATLVVTGLFILLLLSLSSNKISSEHRHKQIEMIINLKSQIQESLETDYESRAISLLSKAPTYIQEQLRIYDNLGFELLGRYDDIDKHILHPEDNKEPPISHSVIRSDFGANYDIYVRLQPRLNIIQSHHISGVVLRVSIAIMISFIACYLFTRYLTAPIKQPQKNAHEIVNQLDHSDAFFMKKNQNHTEKMS